AGTAADAPAAGAERVEEGHAGARIGDGGHVRDGTVGAAAVVLPGRLRRERGAAGAGAGPRPLGPAARAAVAQQRRTADRGHEPGTGRERHAEARVPAAGRDGDAREVQVRLRERVVVGRLVAAPAVVLELR